MIHNAEDLRKFREQGKDDLSNVREHEIQCRSTINDFDFLTSFVEQVDTLQVFKAHAIQILSILPAGRQADIYELSVMAHGLVALLADWKS